MEISSLNTSYFKTQTQFGLQGYKNISTVQVEATEKGKIPAGWRAGVGLHKKEQRISKWWHHNFGPLLSEWAPNPVLVSDKKPRLVRGEQNQKQIWQTSRQCTWGFMVAARRANQAGNKIIYSRESLQKKNTLEKASLLFQQFLLCCFAIRVTFTYKTEEWALKSSETKKYRMFSFSKGERPASEPKLTQIATKGYTGKSGISGNVLDEKLTHHRFVFCTLLRHLCHLKILVLN